MFGHRSRGPDMTMYGARHTLIPWSGRPQTPKHTMAAGLLPLQVPICFGCRIWTVFGPRLIPRPHQRTSPLPRLYSLILIPAEPSRETCDETKLYQSATRIARGGGRRVPLGRRFYFLTPLYLNSFPSSALFMDLDETAFHSSSIYVTRRLII